ncbi:MAG: FimB/Mfa2 family fimbrial subunit [Prevotella sp.]|nr:FimB/Mfa2 family fimbrial subunit [Prevotella sp.]
MRRRLLILGLLATLLTNCSLHDESDECCGIRIHFDYFETGQDLFSKEIRSMRHFLFRDNVFTKELASRYDRDIVLMDLDDGDYRLITIANSTSKTWLNEMQEHVTTLDEFWLRVNTLPETRTVSDETYGNSDELCYGNVTFSVDEVVDQQITSVLSNIHCHLHVFVYWKKQLPYGGQYTLRAYNVPSAYQLGDTYNLTDLKYPQMTDTLVVHGKSEYPVNFELEFEMVTLRYTDDNIPVLQLYHDDEPITGQVDLKRAFDWWGWHPGTTLVQNYWLQMEIDEEGTVRLNRWGSGKVLDWINGGTIAG